MDEDATTLANRPPNRSTVHLVFIHELFRFLRWVVVSIAVITGVYFVVDGVVSVMTDVKNPWVEVASIVSAFLTGLLASQTPMYLKLRRFRRYISKHSSRTSQLEIDIDSERTSSGINTDGTHPLD